MKSSRPASAHCRSSKTSTTGALLGEALEEEPPGREEVLPVGRRPLGQPEQVGEPRLEPAALLGVGDVLARSLPGAWRAPTSGASSSRISARMRTISASAQYATPSP